MVLWMGEVKSKLVASGISFSTLERETCETEAQEDEDAAADG